MTTNLIPTTASGLRSPRRVQTQPQVILAGKDFGEMHRPELGRELKAHNAGQGSPLDEAIGVIAMMVDAKRIQAEFGLTEDEVEMMKDEGFDFVEGRLVPREEE